MYTHMFVDDTLCAKYLSSSRIWNYVQGMFFFSLVTPNLVSDEAKLIQVSCVPFYKVLTIKYYFSTDAEITCLKWMSHINEILLCPHSGYLLIIYDYKMLLPYIQYSFKIKYSALLIIFISHQDLWEIPKFNKENITPKYHFSTSEIVFKYVF